jgi:hypothetical protein
MNIPLPTIFAVAGVGLIVVAIVGGGIEVKELKIPKLPTGTRLVAALVGSAFIGLAIQRSSLLVPSPTDTNGPPTIPTVTIDAPQPGTGIPLRVLVQGTAAPPNGALWLVMQDNDGDYYPQRQVVPQANGIWEEPVSLGPAWRGREAWILVVAVPAGTEAPDVSPSRWQLLAKQQVRVHASP